MAVYLCHEQPDLYEHTATVVDALPGRVALDRSAFHPGGGGQVADIGTIEHAGGGAGGTGIETAGGGGWPGPDQGGGLSREVAVRVERGARRRRAQVPHGFHGPNGIRFERLAGQVVTGAQINADGTGRMDFDLSEVDN